jgi:hypothetical protein
MMKDLFSDNYHHWLYLRPMKEINILHTLIPNEKLNVRFKGIFSRKLETLLKVKVPAKGIAYIARFCGNLHVSSIMY